MTLTSERRLRQNREWAARNPEKIALKHRRKLLKLKGLTQGGYDAMLAAQGGRCATCKRTAEESACRGAHLYIDHDHATDRVRGLLCSTCNSALGSAQDDPVLLRALADYLEAAKGK